MRLGHARELGAHRLDLGHIDADAGASAGRRPVDHLQDAPRARDDHRQARLVELAGLARRDDAFARARAENLKVARDRVRAVTRLDGARIGGVDPGEPPGRVARPHRRGQRFEQLPDRVDVTPQLLMLGGKFGELALGAGQVLDAQYRAAADGAAFDRDVALLQGRQRQRKGPALRAQRVDRDPPWHALVGREPGAEGEHAARQRRTQQQRHVAADIRLVAARRPHDDDLRFGEKQRIGAVALLAQLVDFRLLRGKLLRAARPRAQQRDRGHDREHDDAQRQGERGDLVALKPGNGVEIVGHRTQRGLGCCQSGSRTRRPRCRLCRNRSRNGCVLFAHRLRIMSGMSVPLRGSDPGHGPANSPSQMSASANAAHKSDNSLKATRAVRVRTVNGSCVALRIRAG